MFKKILFATTSSALCNNAATVAIELAKKHNAKLLIFHCPAFPTRGFSTYGVDVKTGEGEYYTEEYIARIRAEIEKTYSDELVGLDNYVIETWVGIPHTEILRLARKEDIDLIVMGPHTREEKGAVGYRSIVGSTTQGVSQRAHCPVMIVSQPVAKEKLGFANIIFGTDFSKAADAAFYFALAMAKELGSKLYLFHALDITPPVGKMIQAQEEIEKQLQEAKEKIRDTYLARMQGFDNYEIKVWEGIPYMEIVKFARGSQGDLIVMAHHSDPEKALLGSALEQVVSRATCPVVSVNRRERGAESGK